MYIFVGRFDLVQPSLIQQLRSILDQYQDDGQILKVNQLLVVVIVVLVVVAEKY